MARSQYSTNWIRSHYKKLLAGLGVLLLLAGTAAAASYVTKENLLAEQNIAQETTPMQPMVQPMARPRPVPAPAPQQQVASSQYQRADCDDGNIVGYLAGGTVGGLLGNQIGKGSGKTAATIGGVIGGAYAGSQYLPTRNATCRQ